MFIFYKAIQMRDMWQNFWQKYATASPYASEFQMFTIKIDFESSKSLRNNNIE